MAYDAHGPSIGPSVAEILASHAGGTGSPTKTALRVADAIAARGDDGTWLSTVPRDQLLAAAAEIENRPGRKDAAAVRRAVRGQGQHRRRGRADDAVLPRLRLRRVDDRARGAAAARRGRALRRQDNLDQFATGLNGTRTPYTMPRSVYGGEMISGGSSSGLGTGGRARPGAVRRRHRHRGVGPRARRAQRRRRVQAVARADQHRRAGPGMQVAGLHQRDGGLRSTTSTASST